MKRCGFLKSLLGVVPAVPFINKIELRAATPAPVSMAHGVMRTWWGERYQGWDNFPVANAQHNRLYRPEDFGCTDLDVVVPQRAIFANSSSTGPYVPESIRIRGLRDGKWCDVMTVEEHWPFDTWYRIPLGTSIANNDTQPKS